jgi:hypothetical protein
VTQPELALAGIAACGADGGEIAAMQLSNA